MIVFTPHQVLRVGDDWFTVDAVWYGGLGQVNLIGLVSLTQRTPSDGRVMVPEQILKAAIAGDAELYAPYVEAEEQCAGVTQPNEPLGADVPTAIQGPSLFGKRTAPPEARPHG